jgi:hypothetical protein
VLVELILEEWLKKPEREQAIALASEELCRERKREAQPEAAESANQ